jgi:hypothetical protein
VPDGPGLEPLETRLLASIFDTLLSSQGSDAHQRRAATGSSLGQPFYCSPLASRTSNRPVHDRFRRRARRLAGCPLYQTLKACFSVESAPGTGLLGVRRALSRLAPLGVRSSLAG